jgi:ribosomal-protein-alanine N-acetyltransferase
VLQYPDPPLAAGRVSLRRWSMNDLRLVEEAARDPLLRRGTTLPSPYTPQEGAAYVERQWSRQRTGEGLSLVIALEGESVGGATLMMRRPPVADLGYWLVGRARGEGVGRAAVGLLVPWALAQPGVAAIEALVADENVPSQRLLASHGFAPAGRRRHRVNDLDEELRVYRLTEASVRGRAVPPGRAPA